MLNIATILSSAFLTGSAVLGLHLEKEQLGHAVPMPAEFTLNSPNPATNAKWVTVAVALDWDIKGYLIAHPTIKLATLRQIATEYCSSQVSSNQVTYLELYATSWPTNQQAGAAEAGILKRLDLQQSTKAVDFAEALAANPQNTEVLSWHHWYMMTLERRKQEAAGFAESKHLDTSLSFSTSYPLLQNASVSVLRLSKRNLYAWNYSFGQKQWFPQITEAPSNIVNLGVDWGTPGNEYSRTFQKGPSWQIVFSSKSGTLTRTATFCLQDSFIKGTITKDGFQEETVNSPIANTWGSDVPNVFLNK